MTTEQQKRVEDTALKLKQMLSDFYGSIIFHLSGSKKDVKIEVKEGFVAKTK